MNHLYQIIEKSASHSDRTALTFQNHQISYDTLKESIDRLAAGLLAKGFSSGARIGLMMPNIPQWVVSYYAILKIGAVILPLSIYNKSEELHHELEDAEVKGVIYWHGFRKTMLAAVNKLESYPKLFVLGNPDTDYEINLIKLIELHKPHTEDPITNPDETAVIVYTAGTTGRPKGAELSHSNLMYNMRMCSDFLKLSVEDSIVGCIPFYQPMAQTLIMNTFIANGANIYLFPKFDPAQILHKLDAEKIKAMVGVPSMYRELCEVETDKSPDLSHMRFCISSGDTMRIETMDLFHTKFHVSLIEGYGLTEASPMVSFNDPSRDPKPGSIGVPLHGVDLRIVNEQGEEVMMGAVGEIIVKGPNVMKGYLNRPEATKDAIRDGWLYTGDLARLDESGYGFIVARKNNLIVKSGFSVYPREVEKFLIAYPKIQEAGVVGLPDSLTGEEIYAAIVLKTGEGTTEEEIIEYLKERMAAYKCPKRITFMPSLPRGPSGRLQRDDLKQSIKNKINI